jgi:hypothetical protein
MVNVMVSIDEGVLDVLKVVAGHKGVTVEDLLHDMLMETVEQMKARMDDPLVGALREFGDAESDAASRADDIIQNEWQPD